MKKKKKYERIIATFYSESTLWIESYWRSRNTPKCAHYLNLKYVSSLGSILHIAKAAVSTSIYSFISEERRLMWQAGTTEIFMHFESGKHRYNKTTNIFSKVCQSCDKQTEIKVAIGFGGAASNMKYWECNFMPQNWYVTNCYVLHLCFDVPGRAVTEEIEIRKTIQP